MSMIAPRDIQMPWKGRAHPALNDVINAESMRNRMTFPMLWARRVTQGQSVGRNTVCKYMTEIKAWFIAGEVDKAKRMAVPVMRVRLLAKYPERYDIPTEQHTML